MKEESNYLYIISIIAIVAIVGLFTIFVPKNVETQKFYSATSGQVDLAGQASRALTTKPIIPPPTPIFSRERLLDLDLERASVEDVDINAHVYTGSELCMMESPYLCKKIQYTVDNVNFIDTNIGCNYNFENIDGTNLGPFEDYISYFEYETHEISMRNSLNYHGYLIKLISANSHDNEITLNVKTPWNITKLYQLELDYDEDDHFYDNGLSLSLVDLNYIYSEEYAEPVDAKATINLVEDGELKFMVYCSNTIK